MASTLFTEWSSSTQSITSESYGVISILPISLTADDICGVRHVKIKYLASPVTSVPEVGTSDLWGRWWYCHILTIKQISTPSIPSLIVLRNDADHSQRYIPESSSMLFLLMVDQDSGNLSCTYSILLCICDNAKCFGVIAIITFWLATLVEGCVNHRIRTQWNKWHHSQPERLPYSHKLPEVHWTYHGWIRSAVFVGAGLF